MYGSVCLWPYHKVTGDKQIPEAHWLAFIAASMNSVRYPVWKRRIETILTVVLWPTHMHTTTQACTDPTRDQRQRDRHISLCDLALPSVSDASGRCSGLAGDRCFWPPASVAVGYTESGKWVQEWMLSKRPKKVSLPVYPGILISVNSSSEFFSLSIQDDTGCYSVFCVFIRNSALAKYFVFSWRTEIHVCNPNNSS